MTRRNPDTPKFILKPLIERSTVSSKGLTNLTTKFMSISRKCSLNRSEEKHGKTTSNRFAAFMLEISINLWHEHRSISSPQLQHPLVTILKGSLLKTLSLFSSAWISLRKHCWPKSSKSPSLFLLCLLPTPLVNDHFLHWNEWKPTSDQPPQIPASTTYLFFTFIKMLLINWTWKLLRMNSSTNTTQEKTFLDTSNRRTFCYFSRKIVKHYLEFKKDSLYNLKIS